jgi:hypothetical protein
MNEKCNCSEYITLIAFPLQSVHERASMLPHTHIAYLVYFPPTSLCIRGVLNLFPL